ncbi:GNAT family N-acetyltransferase [Paenibacillaceae bacterium WGS1546]|uniref:GNAT family N-acetyltransferase n=1 Tax=Cohnella sp. WGS1546 TaxID=3366810 RepID=UPI00372D6CD6
MRVEALTEDRSQAFAAYCKKHRSEVDESFLYDEDLRDFEPNAENPTYVVVDEQGAIAGAASLILDDYRRRSGEARFRILHAESEDMACYEQLLQAILTHTAGLAGIYLFVPLVNETLSSFVERLGFKADRYAFLLVRENPELPEVNWPDHYEVRAFRPGQDEADWCAVRNPAFASLKGSETPITPDMVNKMTEAEEYIEDGMMILYHRDKPVGAVRCADDEIDGRPIMNIGPLAVLPEYQGKGLGRSLLRTALRFAASKGYDRTVLCVNADNERAKALYVQEGFKQIEAVACYKRPV